MRINNGFTIIEVIVVIAVIGVLLAIGIGSFNSSQNRAKKEEAVAIAEKVKLHLGTYFSKNDQYPRNQTQVVSDLTASDKVTLANDFSNTSKFSYTATNGAGIACDSTTIRCEKYTITVKKETWNGGAAESDEILRP